MIRTVIFDIGNVLTVFGWKNFIHSFGFPPETEERVGKATVDNPFWHEFDRGFLSDDEMLAGFMNNDPTVEKEIRQIFVSLHGIVTRADYAIPWIQKLKSAGYQVLVLSNFSDKVKRDNEDAMDFLEYVDGGILSFQDKLIKPMPEIYHLILDRYHLTPGECVFMDDTQPNVDAARAIGIHAFRFENQAQAREELKKLGVGAG